VSDSLDALLADGVIDEVLGRIKSGKEATISVVRRGDAILAAKVYKDRSTRSFKNNVEYKEGRKVRNTRTQRAMDNGGKFGRDSAEQAWKSAEADALYRLVDSGVRAPVPVMFYEGVLLMELVLDAAGRPAPRLEELALERDAVMGVYCDLLAQLICLLCCDLVHGDLSPYNILLAADGPTIIDFPQVISAVHNKRAEYFFLRDFENVHSHLAAIDPALRMHQMDGRAIWQAYVRRDLTPQFVPPPAPRAFTQRPSHRPPPPPPRPRVDDYSASPPRPKSEAVAPAPVIRPKKSKALYSHWTGQEPKSAQPNMSARPGAGRRRRRRR
jgi:RIO kinase 1